MKKIVLAAALALLLPGAARAQQPEQVMLMGQLQPIPCTGSALSQNQVVYLENYANGILPSPIYITRVVIWVDGVGPIDSTTVGNISLAVDPGQKNMAASGFPFTQKMEPQYLKTLGILEMNAGGRRLYERDFNPPIAYRSGDALAMAPYCTGGGTNGFLSSAFLGIFYQATGDTPEPPTNQSYLYNQPYDSLSINPDGPGYHGQSTRNIFAGPAGPTSWIRVRVSGYCKLLPPDPNCQPAAAQPVVRVNHLSVGLQSGATSSTQAAPVELKVGLRSGLTAGVGQWVWSDWTPFYNPGGVNFLITSSNFATDQWGNYSWGFKSGGSLGAYASLTDSWNTIDMQGTAVWQPNITQVVDQVQVR